MNMKAPDPKSKRSKRRANRGFVSLEVSSRKHRRMQRRSIVARTHYGKLGEPGEKIGNGAAGFIHKAGGRQRYH